MNLILLLHIEREVTFPPESTLISILCILQIKHFKVNFQFPSQNREVFGLVIPFSSLCLRKKTWVHVFIPLWKLNTNIAQISLFHNFLVYPSSQLYCWFSNIPNLFALLQLWPLLGLPDNSFFFSAQFRPSSLARWSFMLFPYFSFAWSNSCVLPFLIVLTFSTFFYFSWYVNQHFFLTPQLFFPHP